MGAVIASDPIPALASAAEGSRELDALVARHLGFVPSWTDESGTRFYAPGAHLPPGGELPPQWTTSVDTALTLVPDNRMWFVGHLDPTDMRFAATISCGHVGSLEWRAIHKSAAIAICLAALHAREAAP